MDNILINLQHSYNGKFIDQRTISESNNGCSTVNHVETTIVLTQHAEEGQNTLSQDLLDTASRNHLRTPPFLMDAIENGFVKREEEYENMSINETSVKKTVFSLLVVCRKISIVKIHFTEIFRIFNFRLLFFVMFHNL